MIFPKAFAAIFTSDKELVTYASWALRIYMAGIFSIGFQVSCQQSFMALGQAKVSLLLACLRKIILLIPLIFILPNFLNTPESGNCSSAHLFHAVCIAYGNGWGISCRTGKRYHSCYGDNDHLLYTVQFHFKKRER